MELISKKICYKETIFNLRIICLIIKSYIVDVFIKLNLSCFYVFKNFNQFITL